MEIWKDLDNFDIYEISTFGNIRNKNTGRILKPNKHKQGYLIFHLSKNNIKSYHMSHRLVAINFIENPNNLPQVDHIDRNVSNNNIENLRWVTPEQNMWNREYKNISVRPSGSFLVDYSICKGKRHQKIFKNEDDAKLYLEQLKLKYPRNII
jgi:hypothetical protein